MTTNFGRQEELTHMRQIKQVLVAPSRKDHVTNLKHLHYQSAFGHQTWQYGNLPWWAPLHKTVWSFYHVVL